MDLSTLVPVERTVDVLHPVTKEPTGLKLVVVHDSDPRVVEAHRRLYDAERAAGKPDEDRGRKLTMARVVGWEWTGDATFKGEKPKFSPQALAEVCNVPPVRDSIYQAISDDAGFYKA